MPAKRKEKKDREKDRDRLFELTLYPDNPDHAFLILQLKSFQYRSFGVFHDRDVYSDDVIDDETGEVLHQKGESKKLHYHFVIEFDNQFYIRNVAKKLQIEENMIRFVKKGKKECARYYMHWDYPDKFQYDVTDLVGSLAGTMARKLRDVPEDVEIRAIEKFIYSFDRAVSKKELLNFVLCNGYYGTFRRSYNVIMDMIFYEHNQHYYGGREHHDNSVKKF